MTMAVSTVEEYLSALETSKLLQSEQFAQAQGLAGQSSDAAELARALAREKLVSRWQAGTLLALGRRAQLRLGKYKLIERLGKGGMGTVFLAEHVTMNRPVALKIVPRSIANDRASLDRFFAEARAIAALDHPNIVQAYSVDNEMDRYFIVMEYIDGQDLQRMVELSGPLPPDRAANYICQAADGLAHAHARNLVHCDVKPSNLLLNNQGVIKILDLGLARLDQSDEPRDSGEPAFGTVDYMAPEQGLGAENFDHRADVYSLGCTLYFQLTGHPPFPEGTIAQRIVKHQMQQPRDILAERTDTPPVLVEICRRMMAKEPQDRFQTMQEIAAALLPLRGAGNGRAVAAPKPVKPIEEGPINGEADDWLAAPSASAGSSVISRITSSSSSKSGAKRNSGGSGKHHSGGFFSWGRARLAWFNTKLRKIVGAVVGLCLLAAISAAAALPWLLSPPAKPSPAFQAKAADAAKTTGDEVARPIDSAKEVPSSPPLAKDTASTKPVQPAIKSEEKNTAKPPVTETKPEHKVDSRPEPPSENPNPPSTPIEVVQQVSLADLVAAKDLPGIKDITAISLGKLESAAKIDLDLQLIGGETIAKGNPKFELNEEGGDLPAWSVTMADKNKDGSKIARIFLEGGECKFQWAEDVRDRASLLRFCGLQFRSGTNKHFTALTAPKTVPPLLIDIDAPSGRHRFSRNFTLPDASVLRLQLLPLDKTMPRYEIKVQDKTHPVRGKPQEFATGDTVAVRGQAMVTLTKERTPHVIFTIHFDARGKEVTLDIQGTCEIGNRTLPLNAKTLRDFATVVDSATLPTMPGRTRKPAVSAGLIQLLNMTKAELKALDNLVGDLNRNDAIPFCVYVAASKSDDAQKIVIFESGPMGTPKAIGPKKGRGNRQPGRINPDTDAGNGK